MTALVITLASVFGWLTGWFLTARYRVEQWRKRGDKILSGYLLTSRSFNEPRDRPWIAWYALVTSFFWPVVWPALFMSTHLFHRIDKREEAAARVERKRQEEIASWQAVRRDPNASETEKTVAREVLKGLGVK